MEHQSVTRAEFDALKDLSEKRWRNWVALVAGSDDTSCMSRLTKLESQIADIHKVLGEGTYEPTILTRLDKLETDKLDVKTWQHLSGGHNALVADGLHNRLAAVERKLSAQQDRMDEFLCAGDKVFKQPPAASPSGRRKYEFKAWDVTTEQLVTDLRRRADELEAQQVVPVSSNSWVAAAGVLCGCGASTQSPRRITPEELGQFLLDTGLGFDPDNESIAEGLVARINAFIFGEEKK